VGTLVNDLHSELNATEVAEVVSVDSLESIASEIQRAQRLAMPVSTSGGRYAMGGQQFCQGGLLLDTRRLNRILDFDAERGTIRVEAGIQWPELIERIASLQSPSSLSRWAIAQKQTGADRISIGGTISANAHGRGLAMKPFVSDVESLVLVDAQGVAIECSRTQNAELFRLVAGGYGLFGCIYSATLRLVPLRWLEREVQMCSVHDLVARLEARQRAGCLYGDFQFSTDDKSDDFLCNGIMSCYMPVSHDGPPPVDQRTLSAEDWKRLVMLAHVDKGRAYRLYTAHYLATSGQRYASDRQQLAEYLDGYHHDLDRALCAPHRGSEMISELYVPRDRLSDFMADVAEDFRRHDVDLIYGTVRLIERDDESFLAWARERWACVIFNLHTVHTPAGIDRSAQAFRRLIDRAMALGGTYYLTYHRWATREQVMACHPRLRDFLRLKLAHDPEERFQSDWYRHYREWFVHGDDGPRR
jgi:FAD/FMN-containing dehydrogenase